MVRILGASCRVSCFWAFTYALQLCTQKSSLDYNKDVILLLDWFLQHFGNLQMICLNIILFEIFAKS